MRISDWSSDVCSSDLAARRLAEKEQARALLRERTAWDLERQRDEAARAVARREAEQRESDRRAVEQQAAEKRIASGTRPLHATRPRTNCIRSKHPRPGIRSPRNSLARTDGYWSNSSSQPTERSVQRA